MIDISEVQEKSEEVAVLLKTLGHPKRLLLLCFLSESEKTVGELEELCQASQSQISQFLKKMEYEGLVQARREGKSVYYAIKDSRVIELIQSLQDIFCS